MCAIHVRKGGRTGKMQLTGKVGRLLLLLVMLLVLAGKHKQGKVRLGWTVQLQLVHLSHVTDQFAAVTARVGAGGTLVRLKASVRSLVNKECISHGEPLPTVCVLTQVRTLPCVSP